MMNAALQIIDLQVEDEGNRMSEGLSPQLKMASSIVEIKTRKERCTPIDLMLAGYSPVQVFQHWSLAHSFASLTLATTGQP